MNLKKQLSLATQRLTEAEERVKAALHAAQHVSAGSEHGNSGSLSSDFATQNIYPKFKCSDSDPGKQGESCASRGLLCGVHCTVETS